MLIKFPKKDTNSEESNSSPLSNRFKLNRPPTLSGFDSNSFLDRHRSSANNNLGRGSSSDNLLDSLGEDQSPPISPLRLQQLSPSGSSISSWTSSLSQASQLSIDAIDQFNPQFHNDHHNNHSPIGLPTSLLCNSDSNGSTRSSGGGKETYNTKFARRHLDAYRQNDRMRWNFDFDHNRPLDQEQSNHHQASIPRYQWEPTSL